MFLTFKVISLPSLVIGDNFHWSPSNIQDIIGPKIIRESYLGDVGVLSVFKTGFLFPLTYLFATFNLPLTFVYPFLFYFLVMFSFYFFTKEFINNQYLRILAALLYLINPVTPYYYASIINAFSLVLLPLGLKFFVRALRDLKTQQKPKLLSNLGLAALFLSLTVSANEQIVLSVALVTVFLVGTFLFLTYRKYHLSKMFLRVNTANLALAFLIFFVVNLPLLVSVGNIQSAPLATYFQGPTSSRFYQTVDYTYRTVDLDTLLRLGGDSGSGLGTTAWYDLDASTNLFGYVLFGFFVAAILALVLSKKKVVKDKAIFYQSILLFAVSLALIFIIKNIDTNQLTNSFSVLMLKTWETPAKLRVVLMFSALTTILVLFSLMDFSLWLKKKRVLVSAALTLLLVSTLAYNSPWLIGYAGQTTLQEVSDKANWGGLYNQTYVDAVNKLDKESQGGRGIILPFTHKAELYSEPNSRIFQIVSTVNDVSTRLTSEENFSWSKGLGLYSIKTLAVMNGYDSAEGLIFPTPIINDMNTTLQQIRSDSDLQLVDQTQNYKVYKNPDSLPTLYASNNYVLYDDVSTLKYAFDFLNFSDLPVFIKSQSTHSQMAVPSFIESGNYTLHALCLPNNATRNVSVNIVNGEKSRTFQLNDRVFDKLDDYSGLTVFSPKDLVEVSNSQETQSTRLSDITINSSAVSIGTHRSFTLDFTVNVFANGNSSFLSPRILIDTGAEVYFIILHDSGFVELAIERNGVFCSTVIYQYVGYSLRNPNNSINVHLVRDIDNVDVYVNGNLYMAFPIEPKAAKVSLVSEQSTSHFSEINLTDTNQIKLFAVRQDYTQIPFKVLNDGSENSALTVTTNTTNFAVVSQYLYNDLKDVKDLPTVAFGANVFFKGWIFTSSNGFCDQKISIGVTRQTFSYGLTALSIVFTYCMLLYLLKPSLYTWLFRKLKSKTLKEDNP